MATKYEYKLTATCDSMHEVGVAMEAALAVENARKSAIERGDQPMPNISVIFHKNHTFYLWPRGWSTSNPHNATSAFVIIDPEQLKSRED